MMHNHKRRTFQCDVNPGRVLESAQERYNKALETFDDYFQSLGPAITETIRAFEVIVNELETALGTAIFYGYFILCGTTQVYQRNL
jgi:hypothetical protein